MRAVSEWLGLLFAVLVVIYAYSIWQATPDYRPIEACRPVTFTTGIVSDLADAASTQVGGSAHGWMGDINNGCLSYTYNLFVKDQNS
ncbi:hypothetical protein B1757_13315 [Acidithiobacillus marinus]|uniref:Uncharacterized protein n=1 Tax=Acidithiobacillus marinus TaxID=187490 RepID=A0A2I1DIR8_9PROT|nr:hypothetical protein [Acidithiobacillus marinus]PKY09774.1 hypothetical protein B1757_13315 [Acidithiobacillus marinus]